MKLISCSSYGSDYLMFVKVVNQGIDSHLEAFTKSKFQDSGTRLTLEFADSELPILVRRLRELGTAQAVQWANDIESDL